MHTNCTTFTAVIAEYGMLRNMKVAKQSLEFFPDFPFFMKNKNDEIRCQNEA